MDTIEQLKQQIFELEANAFVEPLQKKFEEAKQAYIGKYFSSKSLLYDTPLNGKTHKKNVDISVIKIVDIFYVPDRYSTQRFELFPLDSNTLTMLRRGSIQICLKGVGVTVVSNSCKKSISSTEQYILINDIGRYYETNENVYNNLISIVNENIDDVVSTSLGYLKNDKDKYWQPEIYSEKLQYETLKDKGYKFIELSNKDYNNVYEFLPFIFNGYLLVSPVVKEILADKIVGQQKIIDNTRPWSDYYGYISVEQQTTTQRRIINSCKNILNELNKIL